MKTIKLFGLLFFILFCFSCTNESDEIPKTEEAVDLETKSPGLGGIEICWDEEKQEIDGFGIAQAGWAHSLYANHQREEVMEMLFGEKGLHLNILRGEIFPHYWENENDKSFNLDDDIDLPLKDSFFEIESDDLKRRGQLWITKKAKERFSVEKLFFSAWSPPAYMKSNKNVSGGHLRRDYYQNYADYLAAFYNAYRSAGLEVFAISPSNEPGYSAPWNSCMWNAGKMGLFICQYLGPTFQKEDIQARIVFGENPFWAASPLLSSVSSEDFVNTIMEDFPEIMNFNPIASGHGYTLPEIKELGAFQEMLKTSIVPFHIVEDKKIPVWMTEISTVDALDISMENGLYWAKTFHEYLTQANVNAFIWWGGAMPTSNNESLIILDKSREGYSLTKRYETFGNYTRYIPSGSIRIETLSPDNNLLVSAYKKGKNYTIVVINLSEESFFTSLKFNGVNIDKKLNSYLTDSDNRWRLSVFSSEENGLFKISIPARSIITFSGRII